MRERDRKGHDDKPTSYNHMTLCVCRRDLGRCQIGGSRKQRESYLYNVFWGMTSGVLQREEEVKWAPSYTMLKGSFIFFST